MMEVTMVTNRTILTYKDLYEQLKGCGIKMGDSILVHASLSSLGFVVGGEEVIIRVLLDLVGNEGTIMMPSQTWKNLDPEKGVHWNEPIEWWDKIRGNWPHYDKYTTPSIGMGVIARLFCTWPGVERSSHPARSFAAVGMNAKYLTQFHDLENIFGIGSPLDKLYAIDGYILMIGVGFDKCTSIHLAECIAVFPNKKITIEHSAMLVNGQREWVSYETQDVDDVDFLELGKAYEKAFMTRKYMVGNAEVQYIEQKSLVDWSIKWLEEHRK